MQEKLYHCDLHGGFRAVMYIDRFEMEQYVCRFGHRGIFLTSSNT